MNTQPQTNLPNHFIALENIRVASPCRAEWGRMEGDERVRFCQSCAKNVYNLSALSKADAQKLIADKEGKLCVRYYQRTDGTILTDNCPVGLKIVRRPFQWLVAGFAALLASGAAIASQNASTPATTKAFDVRSLAPVRFVLDRFDSGTPTMGVPAPPPIMGEIACPEPTPKPEPQPEPEPKPEE